MTPPIQPTIGITPSHRSQFDSGGIVLAAEAALFGYLLCVTGYKMSQRDY